MARGFSSRLLQNTQMSQEGAAVDIVYPVLTYPTKVRSFNLDKHPEAGGILQGIKGQYLLFDTGVINVRKYTGYHLTVRAD